MDDYLKYWRVIRQYIKVKYGLTQSDLDMLMFIYTEKYFSKARFDEFSRIVSWDADRFKRLKENGWIESFRKYDPHTNTRAIYQISPDGKRVVQSIYRMLKGEEMPITPKYNPMFKNNAKYMSKVYRNSIRELNSYLKQQQRPSHE
jgi:hypothetical protein